MTSTRSEAMTEKVRVRVRSEYLPERSNLLQSQYFFIYHVEISNEGDLPVQLVSRHWIVLNGQGVEQHVKGPGVVGQTPRLAPGERFSYTSACPLSTPIGSMRGSYKIRLENGHQFDAQIAPFSLVVPSAIN